MAIISLLVTAIALNMQGTRIRSLPPQHWEPPSTRKAMVFRRSLHTHSSLAHFLPYVTRGKLNHLGVWLLQVWPIHAGFPWYVAIHVGTPQLQMVNWTVEFSDWLCMFGVYMLYSGLGCAQFCTCSIAVFICVQPPYILNTTISGCFCNCQPCLHCTCVHWTLLEIWFGWKVCHPTTPILAQCWGSSNPSLPQETSHKRRRFNWANVTFKPIYTRWATISLRCTHGKKSTHNSCLGVRQNIMKKTSFTKTIHMFRML